MPAPPHSAEPPTADQVAAAWAKAIAGTSYTSMSRRALRAYLVVLADVLLRATDGDRVDPGESDQGGWCARRRTFHRRGDTAKSRDGAQ